MMKPVKSKSGFSKCLSFILVLSFLFQIVLSSYSLRSFAQAGTGDPIGVATENTAQPETQEPTGVPTENAAQPETQEPTGVPTENAVPPETHDPTGVPTENTEPETPDSDSTPGENTAETVTIKLAEISPSVQEGAPKFRGTILHYQDGTTVLQDEPEPAKGLMQASGILQTEGIIYAEPNYEVYVQNIPNDPYYHGNEYTQWAFPELEIIEAWETMNVSLRGNSPRPVKVAVLDTGVDSGHEDLQGRLADGINLITDAVDSTDYSDDSRDGHGTHVAGIIAAAANNGTGIAGVAGEFPIQLIPVKVLDGAGVGTVYDVAQGIRWAADQGADIINLSLGSRLPDYPQTLAEAVEYASSKGVLLVAASGNEGKTISSFYPASLPGVISVGASGPEHTEPYFSNRNADFLAPGVDIVSTLPQDQYGSLTGTSMSCAYAAGVASLLISTYEPYTMPEFSEMILSSKKQFTVNYTVYDILNALLAANEAGSGSSVEDTLVFTNVHQNIRLSDTVGIGIRVNQPQNIEQIQFEILDTAQKPVHQQTVSGLAHQYEYIVNLDTTLLDDGVYTFTAASLGPKNRPLASDSVESIIVENENTSGLVVDVVKPDGSAAPGASVNLYYSWMEDGKPSMKTVYSGKADMNGRLLIPNTAATQGHEFVITAQGTEPNFFYYQNVQSPKHIVMDSTNAVCLDVEAYRVDGQPLGGAKLYLELLASNLTWADFSEQSPAADLEVAVINAAGQGNITLTRGSYDFTLKSEVDRYFLTQGGQNLTEDKTLLFQPDNGTIAEVEFQPEDGFVACGMTLYTGDSFDTGLKFSAKGEKGYVSPGTYYAEVYGVMPFNTEFWRYDFHTPNMHIPAGQTTTIREGGELTAALSLDPKYEGNSIFPPSQYIQFQIDVLDTYQNRLFSIRKSATDPQQDYQFLYTTLFVYDDQNTKVGQESGFPRSSEWAASTDLGGGLYRANVELEGGPLANNGAGGKLVSNAVPVTIAGAGDEGGPEAIEFQVFNHSGVEAANTTVVLYEKKNGRYIPITERWNGITDQNGEVTLIAALDEDGEYMAAVLGRFDENNEYENAMGVVVPLQLQNGQRSFIINAHEMDLREVTIQVSDVYGNPFTGKTLYHLYGDDGQGTTVPVTLYDGWNKSELKVLLPNNQKFQLIFTCDDYYLMKEIHLPQDLPPSGEISLGGMDITPVDLVFPSDTQNQWGEYEYKPAALMFYLPGMTETFHPQTFSGHRVYASGGSYRLTAITEHRDKSGTRVYYVDTGAWNTTFIPNSAFEWHIGDEYLAAISVGNEHLLPGQTLNSEHMIMDHYGNQLHAARVTSSGGNLVGGSLPLNQTNHDELAPFFIVKNPSGEEVCKYKADSPELTAMLETTLYQFTSASIPLPEKAGTYAGGIYTLPNDAPAGTYEAVLYTGIGQGEAQTASATFVVDSADAQLDPISPYTTTEFISITGSTLPGCDVEIRYTVNGGAEMVGGQVQSDNTGAFELVNFQLEVEGEYRFTAVVDFQGQPLQSAPVITIADRTPPSGPANLSGEGQDESHILLSWEAPAETDLEKFLIYRDDVKIHEANKNTLSYLDSGLVLETDYRYTVIAVDYAGNQSQPAQITLQTAELGDIEAPTTPAQFTAVAVEGGVDLSWSASTDNVGVTGYKLTRRIKDSSNEEEISLNNEFLTFADRGLLAETTYVYTLVAADEAGNVSLEATAEVTTTQLNLFNVIWKADKNLKGSFILGTQMQIVAYGETARDGFASVEYMDWLDDQGQLLAQPEKKTLEIVLTEGTNNQGNPSGAYAGTFTIREGIAEILSVTGILKDSAGNSVERTAANTPRKVTGTLEITLVLPEAVPSVFLEDLKAEVWSDTVEYGDAIGTPNTGVYNLDGLEASSDYSLSLMINGYPIEEETELPIQCGLIKKIELCPQANASLNVLLVDSDRSPLEGVVVEAYTQEGDLIASGVTNIQGSVLSAWSGNTQKMLPAIFRGRKILIKTILSEQQGIHYEDTQQSVYLSQRENTVALQVRGINRGELTLQIKDEQDQLLQYVIVRAVLENVQETNINGYTYEERTEHGMRFSLPQGYYTLYLDRYGYEQVVIENVYVEGGTARTEVITPIFLKKPYLEIEYIYNEKISDTYQVLIDVFNHRTQETQHTWANRPRGVYLENAQAGDHITILKMGNASAILFESVSTTISDDLYAFAEIEINMVGSIEVKTMDETGKIRRGEERGMELFHQDSGEFYKKAVSSEQKIKTDVREGNYTAILHFGNPGNMVYENADGGIENPYLSGLAAWEEFLNTHEIGYVKIENIHVAWGEFEDLSPQSSIVLPYYQPDKAGMFAGNKGNFLVANKQNARPGENITLKLEYAYQGESIPGNIRFQLGIPENTSIIPGSIVVLDESGAMAPAISVSDAHGANVVLGTLPEGTKEIKGKILYQVTVNDQVDWPVVTAGAWVHYELNGEQKELIGTARTEINLLTLTAPEYTTTHNITVFGQSTPNSAVMIYDHYTLIGETTASKYGVWETDVCLMENGDPSIHYLTAQIQANGETIQSKVQQVYLDSKRPVVDWVSVKTGYSPLKTVNCLEGVGRLLLTIWPYTKIDFSICFTDNSKVENVKIYLGEGAESLETPYAEYNAEKDVFETYIILGEDFPGDVFISYDIVPDFFSPEPVPDEEKLKMNMPHAFANADFTIVQLPTGNMDDWECKDFQFQMTMGGSRKKLDMTLDIRPVENYSRQDGDESVIDDNLPPIYDMKVELEERNGGVAFEISAVIPEELVDAYMNSPGFSSQAKGMDIMIKILGTSPVAAGLSIADLKGILEAEPAFQEKIKRAQALKEFSEKNCTYAGSQIRDKVNSDGLRDMAFKNALITQGINAAGLAVGKIPGAGTKVAVASWALGNLMGMGYDYKWEKLYNKYKKELQEDENCEDEDGKRFPGSPKNDTDDEDRPDNKKRIASPRWIMDPSGFVYEAAEENRVQGVTAILLELNTETGEWEQWDAEAYLQQNPLITDGEGKYAWDVPEGLWKVRFEKDGYEIAYSDELPVPPPQLDVNVPVVSYMAPEVNGVNAINEYIEISFNKYMKTELLTEAFIKVYAEGEETETPGRVEVVNPKTNPNNSAETFATSVRFIPDTPFATGDRYRVYVNKMVRSYAGRAMDADYDAVATITATQPADVEAPANVENVTPAEGYTSLSFSWDNPDSPDHETTRIYWRKSGLPAYLTHDSVGKQTTEYTIYNLAKDTMYQVKITTVDESGNESNGVVVFLKTKCSVCGEQPVDDPDDDDDDEPGNGGQPGGNQPGTGDQPGSGSQPGGGSQPGAGEQPGGGKPTNPPVTPSISPTPIPPETGTTQEPDYWVLDRFIQEINLLENRIRLQVEEGTFTQETKLYAEEQQLKTTPAEKDLRLIGKAIEIRFASEPGKEVKADITFDRALLAGTDARQLGLYRQNDSNPSQWDYVGGLLNVRDGRIEAFLSGSGTYAVMACERSFTDTQSHWAKKEIEILTSRHIIHGNGHGAFEPDRLITRAEFAKLLVMMVKAGYNPDQQLLYAQNTVFTDVDENAWYRDYVREAARYGLIQGNQGRFRPEDAVSRQEMAVMTVRALQRLGYDLGDIPPLTPYSDQNDIADWALDAVSRLYAGGLMKGTGDNAFSPHENASRSQAAMVLYRAMEKAEQISKIRKITGKVQVQGQETLLLEFYCPVVEKTILLKMNFVSTVLKEKVVSQQGLQVTVDAIIQMGNDETIEEAELMVWDVTV